ncbi:hypothetical protein B0T24DRAFT_666327 [Lasiosphaeria ovina]|uniref:Uncharacterized protein n=1 Tax=Lasiosphaeria ovina TaxID=92902 RepID=A0AAE0KBB4_9PEZI|nr:hypothetical protein B0T24DRAFT_666327 [Lasiosphaeria ovina]
MPPRAGSKGKPPRLALTDGTSIVLPSRAPTPPNTAATPTDPTKPASAAKTPVSPARKRFSLTVPPSPYSPRAKFTAARVFTIPQSPPTSQPPPPEEPCPWLWRCHRCRILYRMSCTRRCLECSHEFCRASGSSSGVKTKKRCRSSAGPCRSEFDYTAWAAWGAFRRTTAIAAAAATSDSTAKAPPKTSSSSSSSAETGRKRRRVGISSAMEAYAKFEYVPADSSSTAAYDGGSSDGGSDTTIAMVWEPVAGSEAARVERAKEKMYVRDEHNCWTHCDFPAECRHAVYRACIQGRARAVGDGRHAVLVSSISSPKRDKSARIRRRRAAVVVPLSHSDADDELSPAGPPNYDKELELDQDEQDQLEAIYGLYCVSMVVGEKDSDVSDLEYDLLGTAVAASQRSEPTEGSKRDDNMLYALASPPRPGLDLGPGWHYRG